MRTQGHAVVIGASMAGLVAARTLADHFERVTIIERDRLPSGPDIRGGVPQARHVHVLLLRGTRLLERLFPGLDAELAAAGASRSTGRPMPGCTTSARGNPISRPVSRITSAAGHSSSGRSAVACWRTRASRSASRVTSPAWSPMGTDERRGFGFVPEDDPTKPTRAPTSPPRDARRGRRKTSRPRRTRRDRGGRPCRGRRRP